MRKQRNQVRRKETYRVRAADGIYMPWPRGVFPVQGERRPRVFTPETVVTVLDGDVIRRRLRAGDAVLVTDDETKKLSAKPVKAGKKSTTQGKE